MALFEQIGKKLTDASQGVVKQTRNLTDTTRLNMKISENKRKMSQLLFEMGNDYYTKHRKDLDCEEQRYIDQVNALFHEIVEWQKEIEEIKASETCKVCGSRITEGASFCMSCGTKLGADEVEELEEDKAPVRKCPVCGACVDDDSIFCISCGAKFENDADKPSDDEHRGNEVSVRTCPMCGARAEDDDTFCMICGTKL